MSEANIGINACRQNRPVLWMTYNRFSYWQTKHWPTLLIV